MIWFWKKFKFISFLCIGIGYSILVIFLLNRYRRSIDLTDESYYLSSIYSYMRGDIPISTIWDGHPGFFLFSPFLFIYHKITGGFEGAMLFSRLLYLSFYIICVVILIYLMRKKINIFWGLMVFIPAVFNVPFSIANISYNTITNALLLLSSFSILSSSLYYGRKKDILLIFSGMIYALLAFSYPTLIILCIFNSILIYFFRRMYDNKKNAIYNVVKYISGGIVTAIIMVGYIVIKSGIAEFFNGISGILTSPYKNTHDKINITYFVNVFIYPLVDCFRSIYFKYIILCIVVITIMIAIIKNSTKKIIIAFFPLVLAICSLYFIKIDIKYFYIFAIITAFIMLLTIRDKCQRVSLILIIYTPSLWAIVTYSLSSNNNNVMYGMFYATPIICALLYCTYCFMQQYEYTLKCNIISSCTFAALSLMICSIYLNSFYTYVFRDEPINKLTYKVESGVYKGIYTTEERKNGLEKLENTLHNYSETNKTVLVANHFPGAYIMSGMKPFSPTIFEPLLMDYGFTSAEPLYKYYSSRKGMPEVLLIILYKNVTNFYNNDKYEINKFINDNYVLKYQDQDTYYPIYIYKLK